MIKEKFKYYYLEIKILLFARSNIWTNVKWHEINMKYLFNIKTIYTYSSITDLCSFAAVRGSFIQSGHWETEGFEKKKLKKHVFVKVILF